MINLRLIVGIIVGIIIAIAFVSFIAYTASFVIAGYEQGNKEMEAQYAKDVIDSFNPQ